MHGAVREEEEEEEEYNLFNHSSKTTPPAHACLSAGVATRLQIYSRSPFSSDVSGAALRTDGVGQSWRGVTVKMSP